MTETAFRAKIGLEEQPFDPTAWAKISREWFPTTGLTGNTRGNQVTAHA